ncbi:MAG: RES family NAD+ phosphorylase [Pseudomonadota bacterium]
MPTDDLDNDLPNQRRICAACVGEPFLKSLIRKRAALAFCSFCDRRKGPTFTLEQMADQIERTFADHYRRTSDQPDPMEDIAQRHGDYTWVRHGEAVNEAIQIAAQIEPEPGDAIAAILAERHDTMAPGDPDEEQEFDSDSHYERLRAAEDDHFHQDWDRFEQSLKSEARFFSRAAQTVLSDIFDGIALVRTKIGGSVIFVAGPGTALTSLFRARVFQTQEKLRAALERPDLEIAPPPSVFAKAGRMNARGVPVFYGATDKRIAMAEVRPPVGADVIVARFELTRALRLLDVAALGAVFVDGSIFDPTLAAQQKRALFLQTLSTKITRPVMPDAEDFEYLVTQAMADYLADHPDLELDGILLPKVISTSSTPPLSIMTMGLAPSCQRRAPTIPGIGHRC